MSGTERAVGMTVVYVGKGARTVDWKKLFHKILYPPLWLIVLLVLFSVPAMIVIFVNGWDTHPLACACYVPAAYAVTVLSIACVAVFPQRYRQLKQRVYEHPLGYQWMTDADWQTGVRLSLSLLLNLAFAAVYVVTGLLYHTAWFIVLAAYNAILAVLRYVLVRYVRRSAQNDSAYDEWRCVRICAWILLLMSLVLIAMVLMIVFQNRGYEYQGLLIYVVATYTFYTTVTATVDIARSKRHHSPVMMMTKVIKLAAAMVSMLALETAMLTQFGSNADGTLRHTMVSVTGGVVVLIITLLSWTIIIHASRILHKLKRQRER